MDTGSCTRVGRKDSSLTPLSSCSNQPSCQKSKKGFFVEGAIHQSQSTAWQPQELEPSTKHPTIQRVQWAVGSGCAQPLLLGWHWQSRLVEFPSHDSVMTATSIIIRTSLTHLPVKVSHCLTVSGASRWRRTRRRSP